MDLGYAALVDSAELAEKDSLMLLYSVVCLAIGMLIPFQVSMNSRAGILAGSVPAANSVFWLVGLVTSAVVSAGSLLRPGGISLSAVPPQLWSAGALASALTIAMSLIIPKVGVGKMTFLMMVGQIVTSAIMSDQGLFGTPRDGLTSRKLIGIVAMFIGLALYTLPSFEER